MPAWDLIAGHLCVSSVLAAERHRLRKGVGQEVVLSLKDVAAATLGHLGMIGDAVVNDTPRTKSGNALYGAYGQDFLCADGPPRHGDRLDRATVVRFWSRSPAQGKTWTVWPAGQGAIWQTKARGGTCAQRSPRSSSVVCRAPIGGRCSAL